MNPSEWVPVTREESGWSYNGPFSTTKEWHSAGVGAGAGLAAGLTGSTWPLIAVAGFALGRLGDPRPEVGHLRDVAAEPAYALGMASVFYLLAILA